MKIRNGFVSNSSSASFIIGVAVLPKGRLKKAKEYKNLTIVDLKNPERSWKYHIDREYQKISVQSFDYTEVSTKYTEGNKHAVVLHQGGKEPEYDEIKWEYNYDEIDMTEEWFSTSQLDAAAFIKECGGKVLCGGGRDG